MTVDEYLKNVTPSQKEALIRIREMVKKLVPEVEEVISYGMPTFRFHNRNMIHYAAFKNHLSIFPTAEPVATLKDKLKDFKTAKGTIQFTEQNSVPNDLLKELILACRDRILNR